MTMCRCAGRLRCRSCWIRMLDLVEDILSQLESEGRDCSEWRRALAFLVAADLKSNDGNES